MCNLDIILFHIIRISSVIESKDYVNCSLAKINSHKHFRKNLFQCFAFLRNIINLIHDKYMLCFTILVIRCSHWILELLLFFFASLENCGFLRLQRALWRLQEERDDKSTTQSLGKLRNQNYYVLDGMLYICSIFRFA